MPPRRIPAPVLPPKRIHVPSAKPVIAHDPIIVHPVAVDPRPVASDLPVVAVVSNTVALDKLQLDPLVDVLPTVIDPNDVAPSADNRQFLELATLGEYDSSLVLFDPVAAFSAAEHAAVSSPVRMTKQTKAALKAAAPVIPVAPLPASVDLSAKMPPVLDQGVWSSCSSCVASNALRYFWGIDFQPSVAFLFYLGRVAFDRRSPNDGIGQTITTIMKVPLKYNICADSVYTYPASPFQPPPIEAFMPANQLIPTHKKYQSKTMFLSINNMKACLAMGMPVMVSIALYLSSKNSVVGKTGVLPVPMTIAGDKVLGGHSILLTGYDDATKMFTFMNSWGTGWGKDGFGFIPYDYIGNSRLAYNPQVIM